jgi:hypothetical protein
MPERISYDHHGNLELSVSSIQLLQLEYMSDNRVWMRLHRDNGSDIVVWLVSREKITGTTERV